MTELIDQLKQFRKEAIGLNDEIERNATIRHEHCNKAVLDEISYDEIERWDSSVVHSITNKEIDNITGWCN